MLVHRFAGANNITHDPSCDRVLNCCRRMADETLAVYTPVYSVQHIPTATMFEPR